MYKLNCDNIKDYNIKLRVMFGKLVKNLVEQNDDIVFCVADAAKACRFEGLDKCPEKFIECGIAEQNLAGVAAGLARSGKIPITFGFTPFVSERCFEQVKLDIVYSKLHVIIVGSEGGVGLGTQGVTHFGWEDVAVMRSLPNMKIMCPADTNQLIKCLKVALTLDGPVYIRLNGGIPENVYNEDSNFNFGKGIVHSVGKDINIVSTGTCLSTALKVSKNLVKEGISVGVIDMHTIKPIDEQLIKKISGEAKLILTMEEHSIVNGLGTAVSDVITKYGTGNRLIKLGLPDEYPKTVSPYPDMMKDYGLTVDGVVKTIKENLKIS